MQEIKSYAKISLVLFKEKIMLKEKKRNLIGLSLLLIATLAWGTSFVVLKDTIETVPGFFVIGVRFFVAGIILGLIFIKRIIKVDKKTILNAFILGLVVALAYLFQTEGLKYTTPGSNAFLTATYCVLTPFIMWVFFKKKPRGYNIIAAIVCIVGIGLIVLSGAKEEGSNKVLGDFLTLISAIFYALQILFIDKFNSQKTDPIALLIIHFIFTGLIVLGTSFIYELPQMGIESYSLNLEQILKILYLMIVCTLLAQGAQLFGQKLCSNPTQSAIVLSLESVFGAIISLIFGADKFSFTLIIGFVVVISAILIGELKIDFGISKLFKKKN